MQLNLWALDRPQPALQSMTGGQGVAEVNGLTQAIIDRCPVRHTRPVGPNYSTETARRQMQLYLQKYGNPMPVPAVYTYLG